MADQCARAVAHTPSDAAERLIIEPVNRAHNLLCNEAQAVVNLAAETVRQAERELAALWEAVQVAHAQALRTAAAEAQHREHVEAVHRQSRTTVYALTAVAVALLVILIIVLTTSQGGS